jgi:hypothetical protein
MSISLAADAIVYHRMRRSSERIEGLARDKLTTVGGTDAAAGAALERHHPFHEPTGTFETSVYPSV